MNASSALSTQGPRGAEDQEPRRTRGRQGPRGSRAHWAAGAQGSRRHLPTRPSLQTSRVSGSYWGSEEPHSPGCSARACVTPEPAVCATGRATTAWGYVHGRERAGPVHAAATQWPPSSTGGTRRVGRPPDAFKCRLWRVPLSAEQAPTPVPEIQGSRRPSAAGKATRPPPNTSLRGPWLSREAGPGLCFLL